MKILIIENEKPLIDIIIDLYEEVHEITYFTDLNSALSYISSTTTLLPDLVMLDLRMNGKNRNGFEVYDLIRSVWGLKVPIAIVTGCDDELLEKAVILSKTDVNLKVYGKPFGTEDLELMFQESQIETPLSLTLQTSENQGSS